MRGPDNGLTFIETLIVVAMIAIAARVVVPMVGAVGSMQVRSVADIGKGQNFQWYLTQPLSLNLVISEVLIAVEVGRL